MRNDFDTRGLSLKKSRDRFIRTAVYMIMMALILSGVAPSFASGKDDSVTSGVETVPSCEVDWSDAPDIEGKTGILIDAGSGTVLYEKNAYERRSPASITKIITVLIALEELDPDTIITIPGDSDLIDDSIVFRKGEQYTAEILMHAALMESSNAAAEALAVHIAGSEEAFAGMMNSRAEECGARDTTFCNASGLNDPGSEEHKSTAYDVSMIAREAMKNEKFRKIAGTAEYDFPEAANADDKVMENTNLCLSEKDKTVVVDGKRRPFRYEGTTGVKTGYTSTSGGCFCGSAEIGGTYLIAVSLGSEGREARFADVMSLWDYGFEKYRSQTAAEAGDDLDSFAVWHGDKSSVDVTVPQDLKVTLAASDETDDFKVKIKKSRFMLKAPVKKGDVLGYAAAYNEEGDPVAVSEVTAAEDVDEGGILSYAGIADEHIPVFLTLVTLLLAAAAGLKLYKVSQAEKRRKRRAERRRRK